MAVRVNKSAFNIREKLTELTKKFGLKGSELAAAETTQDARDLVSAGRKNMIINGDMRIAQRGTSETSVTSTGYYTVDHFASTFNNLGTWTVSRESDAPDGFRYSLKHTCTTADASPTTGDYAIVYQKFEMQDVEHLNYGSTAAKDVTLSFWVKSNKSGPASVGIFIFSGGSPYFLSKKYTINDSNTWEHKTVTFKGNTDFAVTGGDNTWGFTVEWWMNSGPNYQGNTENIWTSSDGRNLANLGVGGATSDYFSLTGVQLEVGKNATEFEHRSYGEELALCQRYYFRLNSEGSNHPIANVYGESGSQVYGTFYFPVQMRAAPTNFTNSGSSSHFTVIHAGTGTNGPTMFASTLTTAGIGLNTAGSGTLAVAAASQLRFTTTAGWIAFEAEL